jgi:hypothetical protein
VAMMGLINIELQQNGNKTTPCLIQNLSETTGKQFLPEYNPLFRVTIIL